MSKEAVIYLTIAVYFVLMIAVGVLSRRSSRTISDFTVGTRSASAWLSAFSYGTAYFSAVMFIGYAGSSGWEYGIWGVLPGIGNAIFGSLLAWMVLANRTREVTRRLNIRSMPQLFEKDVYKRQVGWYLSLERFDGTLTGEQRALYPLRDLLSGKIRPDMFLDALRVLRADEEAKNTAGIRENLLYHKDMSYISAENAGKEAGKKEETL